MAYRLLPQNGDCISVPQLVFKNLNNGQEDYFRVALYLLAGGECDEAALTEALNLKNTAAAARALAFWQGAGLLEEEAKAAHPAQELKKRHPRLTTREVLLHSGQNPEIAVLMQEAQSVFGEVISESGCNTLATMYVSDKMPLDFLLIGLAHFAEQGYTSQKLSTIQRRMESWQEEGIGSAARLEEYLKLLTARGEHHAAVAALMGCSVDSLTLADQTKINIWYEQYHYTEPMISAALGMVGDSEKKTIAYLNGILKKWNSKGYHQPRDVLETQQGTNALPTGRTAPAASGDVLQKNRGRVPKFRLED